MHDADDFQQYNYNKHVNLAVYGDIQPPSIDLSKIEVPVAMFVGKQDELATPEMALWTR